MVEIEEDSRDYGSGDSFHGPSGSGQADEEPAKELEGDNVSNSSNLNIEKAEERTKVNIHSCHSFATVRVLLHSIIVYLFV